LQRPRIVTEEDLVDAKIPPGDVLAQRERAQQGDGGGEGVCYETLPSAGPMAVQNGESGAREEEADRRIGLHRDQAGEHALQAGHPEDPSREDSRPQECDSDAGRARDRPESGQEARPR
jgi:hypothetical protein